MWNSILSWDRPVSAPLDELRQELDSLFGDIGFSDIRSAPRGSFPLVNVVDTADRIRVLVFAPGVEADSLDVRMQNNVLSINGQRRSEASRGGGDGTYHRRERFEGEFSRSISLPETADPDAVEANLNNGVLTVTIKKRAEVQPRRIDIKANN